MEKMTRRRFVKTSAKTAAGIYCGTAVAALAGTKYSLAANKVLGANEKINFALIGCGGRGRYVARGLIQQGARLVYICDLMPD